jgi:hypothetical protein
MQFSNKISSKVTLIASTNKDSIKSKISIIHQYLPHPIPSAVTDCEYSLYCINNRIGPSYGDYYIAIKIDPNDVSKWLSKCVPTDKFNEKVENKLYLRRSEWEYKSDAKYYRYSYYNTVIYRTEGIILLEQHF